MADIFDVDNQENYDVQEFDNEPSEQDYVGSLEKKPHLDGVYSTGVHPSIQKSHAVDADDFYDMMAQQTWIPEQVEKADKKPLDIFEEIRHDHDAETSNMLMWDNLQPQINIDRNQLDLWGQSQKETSATNPSHYNEVPADLQHWDVVERMGWGYHVGCATKYIWRAGKKQSAAMGLEQKEVEDLEKAMVYLQKRIDLIKGEK